MPATGILFRDYAKHPIPKRVYCDSNFALKLLNYALLHPNPALIQPIDTACFNFYQQLKTDKVELIASLLTFSEVMHVYCFQYPKGMYERSKAFLQTKVSGVPSSPHECFKRLVKRYRPDADTIWNSLTYRVEAVDDLFSRYGIRILSPLPSPGLTNVTKNVADFAAVIKFEFSAIESTDAVHLALASYLAADAVVSLDQDYLSADNFTIYWTP
jgi:hypothetical protein